MRGNERNKPCHCGSGLKAKRCDRPHLEVIEEAHEENRTRDQLKLYRERRARGLSPLALIPLVFA